MTHDVILIQSGYRLAERRKFLEEYFAVTELGRCPINFFRSTAGDTLVIFRLKRKENDSTGDVVGRSIVDETIDKFSSSNARAKSFEDMSESLSRELEQEKDNRALKSQFEKDGVVVLKKNITEQHINHIIKTISSELPEVHDLSDNYIEPWLPHMRDFLGDDVELTRRAYFETPKVKARDWYSDDFYDGPCNTAYVFIPLKQGKCIKFRVGTNKVNNERINDSWVERGQPIIFDSRVGLRANKKIADGGLFLTFHNSKLLQSGII